MNPASSVVFFFGGSNADSSKATSRPASNAKERCHVHDPAISSQRVSFKRHQNHSQIKSASKNGGMGRSMG